MNGAPLLLVYRPDIIPGLTGVLRTWRKTAEDLGDPRAAHLRGPELRLFDRPRRWLRCHGRVPAAQHRRWRDHRQGAGVSPRFKGKIYSYPEVVRWCLRLGSGLGLPVYRGLMTGWDNTPRRGYASHIFHNATPEHYEVWLRRLIDHTRRHHEGDHRLIFVNAWNEWGEGAYLEPDQSISTACSKRPPAPFSACPSPARCSPRCDRLPPTATKRRAC